MNSTARKVIGYWLILGCILVFFQVIIGGVTRLTGSGLSITEWKPIVGAVPPITEADWNARFDEYKTIAQFKHVNQDMNLTEFKFIYFWEYFHRLWARFMGFAFIIPFFFFLYKKWIPAPLLKRLSIVLLWGGLVGLYGWVMVKNGLTGLYVPPVFLSIHLILALSLFSYLVWLASYVLGSDTQNGLLPASLKKGIWIAFLLLFAQVFLGGIVSGMKAGLAYPTWPDMNGEFIPVALTNLSPTLQGIFHYDPADFWGRTFIQFVHRSVAYILAALLLWLWFSNQKLTTNKSALIGIRLLPFTVLFQVTIGIFTVLNCVGEIPVFWGVMHQAGAMLLIANLSFLVYKVSRNQTY